MRQLVYNLNPLLTMKSQTLLCLPQNFVVFLNQLQMSQLQVSLVIIEAFYACYMQCAIRR